MRRTREGGNISGQPNDLAYSVDDVKFGQYALVIVGIKLAVRGHDGLIHFYARRIGRRKCFPKPPLPSAQIDQIHLRGCASDLVNKQGTAISAPSNRPITSFEPGDDTGLPSINRICEELLLVSCCEDDRRSVRGNGKARRRRGERFFGGDGPRLPAI